MGFSNVSCFKSTMMLGIAYKVLGSKLPDRLLRRSVSRKDIFDAVIARGPALTTGWQSRRLTI